MSNIKCPSCGESHYIEHYSTTTAMYYPPIYKDGINVNPDGNITTTYCTCCNCNHNFHYEIQNGVILSITNDGEAKSTSINYSESISVADNTIKASDIDSFTIKPPSVKNEITIPTSLDIERLEKKIDELAQKLDQIISLTLHKIML